MGWLADRTCGHARWLFGPQPPMAAATGAGRLVISMKGNGQRVKAHGPRSTFGQVRGLWSKSGAPAPFRPWGHGPRAARAFGRRNVPGATPDQIRRGPRLRACAAYSIVPTDQNSVSPELSSVPSLSVTTQPSPAASMAKPSTLSTT